MKNEKEEREMGALLQLIQEHPDLPVLALVNAEIVDDDCGCWLGKFGIAYVDEYLLPHGDRPPVFRSDDDVFNALEQMLSPDEYEALPEDESACRPAYEALPWKKAIFVYVGTPDEKA